MIHDVPLLLTVVSWFSGYHYFKLNSTKLGLMFYADSNPAWGVPIGNKGFRQEKRGGLK